MSRRRAYTLAVLSLLAGAVSCEEDTAQPGPAGEGPGAQLCAEVATRLRGCQLLSEGEPNCGLFRSPEYTECVRPCLGAASCEDFRAQACDDVDNALAQCLERCLFEAATIDCGDGTSADVDDVCDDVADCANGADEQGCSEPDAMFACDDGGRVFADEQCDGSEDCADGSDEAGCPMRAMTLCPGGF